MQWSDGRIERGAIEFSQTLTLHDGTTLRSIPASQIRAILLRPEEEGMQQGWRFVQPGQPRKEPVGRPYPMRHLVASVLTIGGEQLVGHLTTTIAWLTASGQDDRVRIIIPAKQEGGEGQTLADLVYPVRIAPALEAAAAPSHLRWQDGSRHGPGLVVVTCPDLARMALPGEGPSWTLPAPVAAPLVIACPAGDGWYVAWPPPGDAHLAQLLADAVANAQDFLDHRQLLGTWSQGPDQLYGLLMLMRVGPTTMAGPDRPWRLELWRWKREGDHLLWAARAYLARGLASNVGALPPVHLETSWWLQGAGDAMVLVGEPPHGR